jgi:hypothetical protein
MDLAAARKINALAFGVSVNLEQSKTCPFIFYGYIDGYGVKPTAVLHVTAEGNFTDFVCNQEGLVRIVTAVTNGTLGEALVVHASIANDGTVSAVGIKNALETHDKICQENPRTKNSARGLIWILSPSFFGLEAPAYNEPF